MKLDTQFNPPNASMIPFISFLLLNFGTMYAMKEVEWFWIRNYVSRLVLDIEGEQKGGKIVLNEKNPTEKKEICQKKKIFKCIRII